jgi:hypothetical protein
LARFTRSLRHTSAACVLLLASELRHEIFELRVDNFLNYLPYILADLRMSNLKASPFLTSAVLTCDVRYFLPLACPQGMQ